MFDSLARRDLLLSGGLIVLACIAVYARSLGNGFVGWDDGLLVLDNALVQEFSFRSIFQVFTSYDPELYIPLTLFTFQLNHLFAGLSPWIYHTTNLLLHMANSLFVAGFAYLLFKRGWVAVATALLFAVHPLNTEAVAWVSGRKDVLMAFFALPMLIAYLRYRETGDRKFYYVSIALFVLALLSKVTVILAPLALVLLDWYRGRAMTKELWIEKIPYFGVAILFGVIAMFGKIANTSFFLEKFLIGCKTIIFFLWKLLIPTGLSVLYPYTKPISLFTPDLLISVLLVIAISFAVFFAVQKSKLPLLAWVFFLLFLLPSMTNVAKGRNELLDVYFASDRYAYLPSIGFFFLVSLLFDEARTRWKFPAMIVGALIILALSVLTFLQSLVWKDSASLFGNVLKYYPDSYVAHTNIGTDLFHKGDVEGALAEYEAALAIREDGTAHYNIGQIHLMNGEVNLAIDSFRSAVAASPADADAQLYLGALLSEQGDVDEAITHLKEATVLNPSLLQAHLSLADAYEQAGKVSLAIASYEQVVRLDPDHILAKSRLNELR
ncbi:hypothetical protein A3D88_00720 [Candidatus Peribacteria bacterium RIFCSPHIGHO2_02_FULL_52_16]|nr:MAG: hypothetical protein A2706_00790 [Candidatus Peribacteria bacterium RIFCSPHIGHO2_01_FULL_51_35]OGJ61192.1 MAG: hypothetical protein A3D88_00720 [Candidatus Peribacteria bacterium RIFCSPHIGHO2_02_FULL_52_16]